MVGIRDPPHRTRLWEREERPWGPRGLFLFSQRFLRSGWAQEEAGGGYGSPAAEVRKEGSLGWGGVGIWEAAPPSEAVARSAQDKGWHLCLHHVFANSTLAPPSFCPARKPLAEGRAL